MGIGFDAGPFNLICARRGEGDEVKIKKDINAFIKIPIDNSYMINMFKKAQVAIIERKKMGYVCGEAALNMAYTLGVDLCRPMKDGTVNPTESDSFEILKTMIHSLIGEVSRDKETVYYCIPADAINAETNAFYHQKVLEQIFKAYSVNKKTVLAYPINEALALIYAELQTKNYTGIGLSFGAGMVNFCYSIFSQPAISFSIVNSGDWIDKQVAKATNTPVTFVNKEKMKIDLLKSPTTPMERAIITTYRILIETTITQIKDAIVKEGQKVRTEAPLDIVIGGGTATPNGFEHLIREAINSSDFPVPVGDIIKPKDHLFAVARGCLCAAENAV
jgi:hypothetical protein